MAGPSVEFKDCCRRLWGWQGARSPKDYGGRGGSNFQRFCMPSFITETNCGRKSVSLICKRQGVDYFLLSHVQNDKKYLKCDWSVGRGFLGENEVQAYVGLLRFQCILRKHMNGWWNLMTNTIKQLIHVGKVIFLKLWINPIPTFNLMSIDLAPTHFYSPRNNYGRSL